MAQLLDDGQDGGLWRAQVVRQEGQGLLAFAVGQPLGGQVDELDQPAALVGAGPGGTDIHPPVTLLPVLMFACQPGGVVVDVGGGGAEDRVEAFADVGAAFADVAEGILEALVAQQWSLFVVGHQHRVRQALQAVGQEAVELADLLGGLLDAGKLGGDRFVQR